MKLIIIPSPSNQKQNYEVPSDLIDLIIKHSVQIGIKRQLTHPANILKETEQICATLSAIESSCKTMHELLRSSPYWRSVLDMFNASSDNHCRDTLTALHLVRNGAVTVRRAIALVSGTGCEVCATARIRKIHWPFSLRCCQPCLERLTISNYRIQHDYGLPANSFQHLPHSSVRMWSHRGGFYHLCFFMLDEIYNIFMARAAEQERGKEFLKRHAGISQLMRENYRVSEILKQKRSDAALYPAIHARKIAYFMANKALHGGNYTICENDLDKSNAEFVKIKEIDMNPSTVRVIYLDVSFHKLRSNVCRWVRELANDDVVTKYDNSVIWPVIDACFGHVKLIFDDHEDARRDKNWFRANVWNGENGRRMLKDRQCVFAQSHGYAMK